MRHLLRMSAAMAALTAGLSLVERPVLGSFVQPDSAGLVLIPAGSYRPLYRQPTRDEDGNERQTAVRRRVAGFEMDRYPVTNAQFLAFVHQHPEWRRSRAKKLFVDDNYLAHWRGDLDLGPMAPPTSPVVNVSWFAARAYVREQGKDLPTVDQWEYVAAADERRVDASRDGTFLNRIREWAGRPVPQPLPPIGSGMSTVYGVRDLHGLVWEWTLDFNSALVTGESRGDSALERSLFCGSGALGAADFEDYAAFMRYALRGSLEARYGVGSVGFRGVRSAGGGAR